jgi:predicted nuclease of predicted toxin-antitoxin system
MRILIDECLDWRLCRSFAEDKCSSVRKMGWSGLTNGELLEKAQADFDMFLTGDRNLTFQQRLSKFRIAVVVLQAESIQLDHTLPLIPKVLALRPTLKPGQVVYVSAES